MITFWRSSSTNVNWNISHWELELKEVRSNSRVTQDFKVSR